MPLEGIHKTSRPHRIPLTMRWLAALFVCLLVFATALIVGGLATFAATPWTITPSSTLTAGDANCPANADGSWTCSINLGNPNPPGRGVNWTSRTSAKGSKGRLGGVTFTPSSGILSGGETTPISIHIPRTAAACQNGFFQFYDFNVRHILAQATWTCKFTPVVMVVTPTSFNASTDPNCTTDSVTYTCTVTLANPVYSTSSFTWTVTSDFGATFQPPFGTLSPNESTPVTFSFLTTYCSGTVTFTGKSLPVNGKGRTPPSPPPVTVSMTTNTCS